ncbi:hypothetical protein Hanom_Chr00s128915g01814651 [Helianthus anomalus]
MISFVISALIIAMDFLTIAPNMIFPSMFGVHSYLDSSHINLTHITYLFVKSVKVWIKIIVVCVCLVSQTPTKLHLVAYCVIFTCIPSVLC